MIEVLVIMAFGILFGVIFRQKQRLISMINKTTMWIIFTLLFFMGISVGANKLVMNNLDTIGLQGLVLSIVAILGSVSLSWIVYVAIYKNNKSEKLH